MENGVVDALSSLAGEPSGSGRVLPVTLAQSCSLEAVAGAEAHAGPPPEGLDGPGTLSELRVARGSTPQDYFIEAWEVDFARRRPGHCGLLE